MVDESVPDLTTPHVPTENAYLYAGEQRDKDLGLDYLRARYLNFGAGRFYGRDPFKGILRSPSSLHGFLYANNNPVSFTDPSGEVTFVELSATVTIANILTVVNPTLFKGAALAIQVELMKPAFQQRNRALEQIALASELDHEVLDNAFALLDQADRVISLRAGLVGATDKLIDYILIGHGSVAMLRQQAQLVLTGYRVTSIQYQRLTQVIERTDEFLAVYQSYANSSVTFVTPQIARDFSRKLFEIEQVSFDVLHQALQEIYSD